MITPTRLSYVVLAATVILAGLLHLGVPLLVVLFAYFALRQLYFLTKRKWLALILFGVVVSRDFRGSRLSHSCGRSGIAGRC